MSAPRRSLVVLVLGLALVLPLTGCAKKNAPVPPEGTPDTYHRQYPSE